MFEGVVGNEVFRVSQSRMGDFERCPRYWYQRVVLGIETPQLASAAAGEKIHKQLEDYVLGRSPTVFGAAAVAARYYPLPSKLDPSKLDPGSGSTGDADSTDSTGSLRVIKEIEWLFRVPYAGARLTGKADLLTLNVPGWGAKIAPPPQNVLRLLDLKTTGAVKWAKSEEQLRQDRQLLSYLVATWRGREEAELEGVSTVAELGQVVVERDPPHRAQLTVVQVDLRHALEQEEADRPLIHRMQAAGRVPKEDWKQVDGPADRSSCERWFGAQCPFYARCHGGGALTTTPSGVVDFSQLDGVGFGVGSSDRSMPNRTVSDGRGGEKTSQALRSPCGVSVSPEATQEGVNTQGALSTQEALNTQGAIKSLKVIDHFRGKYYFLSNFWAEHPFHWMGETWKTAEHAYQAAKTYEHVQRGWVHDAATPEIAKQIGQRVKVRRDWETVKVSTMRSILQAKFLEPELRQLLLDTDEAVLEEGNTWGDVFWGTCGGKGENHLGRLLMEVRAELRAEAEYDPPAWLEGKRTIWHEDDACRAAGDTSRERVEDAWQRLFGEPLPPQPLEVFDEGDAIYKLYAHGRVLCHGYDGDSIDVSKDHDLGRDSDREQEMEKREMEKREALVVTQHSPDAQAAARAAGWNLEVVHDLGGRDEQQDCWEVMLFGEGRYLLLAVADGMGGHVDGAQAARVAVHRAALFLSNCATTSASPGGQVSWTAVLEAALKVAHREVLQQVPGGGTTLTLLVLPACPLPPGFEFEDQGFFAQVGDSMIWDMSDHLQRPERVTDRHGIGHQLLLHIGDAHTDRPDVLARDGVRPHVGRTRAKAWALATDGLCPDLPADTGLWGGAAALHRASYPPKSTLTETLGAARAAGSTDNATGLRVWRIQKDKETTMGIINPPDAAPAQGMGGFEGRVEVSRATILKGFTFRTIKGQRHDRSWELRLWNGDGGRWKFIVEGQPAQEGILPKAAEVDVEQINRLVLHPHLKAWDERVQAAAHAAATALISAPADPFAAISQAVAEVEASAASSPASGGEGTRQIQELMSRGLTEARASALVRGGVTVARLQAGDVTLPELLACDRIGEGTARKILAQFAQSSAPPQAPPQAPAQVSTPAPAPSSVLTPTQGDVWGDLAPALTSRAVGAPVVQSGTPNPGVDTPALATAQSQHAQPEQPTQAPQTQQPPAPTPSTTPARGYHLMIGARPTKGTESVDFLTLVKPYLDACAALPHKRDDGTRGPVADVLLVPYLGAAAALDDLLRAMPPFDGRWIVVDRGCPYWAKLQRPFLDRAEMVVVGV